MAEFTVPDAARLERLLRDAYELAPGPHMDRLARIEAQLLRRLPPRPSTRGFGRLPAWLLLLAAGAATAAGWWLAESSRGRFNEETAVTELPEPADSGSARSVIPSEPSDPSSDSGPASRDSPVIYSREPP